LETREAAKVKVLFLAANPHETSRLRLGQECRDIDSELRQSKYREQFELVQSHGVSVTELQKLVLMHNPDILHFSGHGSEEGALIFEHKSGFSEELQPDILADLFRVVNKENSIRCVVLNSCYSEVQANEIVKYVDCVVGMPNAVSDQAATKFSQSFYRAIGYGRSVGDAFELGKNELKLLGISDDLFPKIKSRRDPYKILFIRKSDARKRSLFTVGDKSIRREILIAIIAGPLATIIALSWPGIVGYVEDVNARNIIPIAVAEDCEPFSPSAVVVNRVGEDWKIIDGESGFQMLDFKNNKENAEKGVQAIKTHGFNKICFVGRPYNPVSNPVLPLMYFLVNETAPRDVFNEQGCTNLNPKGISTRKVADDWYVLEGNIRIYDFGAASKSRENAERAAQLLQAHEFTKICTIDRPIQPMTYYLAEHRQSGSLAGLPGFTAFFNQMHYILSESEPAGQAGGNDAGVSHSEDAPSDCPVDNSTSTIPNNSTTDDIYPRISIAYPVYDANISSTTFGLAGSSSDEGLGVGRVEVQVDNSPRELATPRSADDWTEWSATIATENGQHLILARAQDWACLPAFATTRVMVDDADPTIAITSHDDDAVVNVAQFTLRGSASDEYSGLKSIEVKVGSGQYFPISLRNDWSRDILLPSEGDYVIYAKATDYAENSAVSSIDLSYQLTPISNQAPIAHAGSDITAQTGIMINLDGTASSDPDGQIVQYAWSIESGPGATLINPTTSTPHFTTPFVDGIEELRLRLTVTDDDGQQDSDTVEIKIVPQNTDPDPGPNQPEEQESTPFSLVTTLDGNIHLIRGSSHGVNPTSFAIQPNSNLVRVNLETHGDSNPLQITVSNQMISGIQEIRTDNGGSLSFEVSDSENLDTTINLNVPQGTHYIDIMAANVVPEFPVYLSVTVALALGVIVFVRTIASVPRYES
jgi:hypothetical protein